MQLTVTVLVQRLGSRSAWRDTDMRVRRAVAAVLNQAMQNGTDSHRAPTHQAQRQVIRDELLHPLHRNVCKPVNKLSFVQSLRSAVFRRYTAQSLAAIAVTTRSSQKQYAPVVVSDASKLFRYDARH